MSQLQFVILDTSFLIQCFAGNTDDFKLIIQLTNKGKIKLAVCKESKLELSYKLNDPNIKKYLGKNQNKISKFIAWYKYNSTSFIIQDKHSLKRDISDSIWLNLIDSSNSHYLISHDKDLLQLKSFQNCKILKPKDFFREFDN